VPQVEPPPGLGLGVCVGGERGFSHAFRERIVALSGGRVGGDHEVELGIGGRSRVRSPASVSRASSQRWPLLAAFCPGLHPPYSSRCRRSSSARTRCTACLDASAENGGSPTHSERGWLHCQGGRVGGNHEVELGVGGRSRVRSPASVYRASSQRWPLLAACWVIT